MSLKVYSREELAAILEAHRKYLLGEKGGTSADLRYADLTSADLTSADLRYADLRYADLTSADLTSADLRYADLRYADLTSADLTSANLTSADLTSADLTSANLTSANLRSADLTSANLTETKWPAYLIVPEVGAFTAFKSAIDSTGKPAVLTLTVPAKARRTGGLIGRKCRVSEAKVTAGTGTSPWHSSYDPKFTYAIGQTVKPDEYDPDFTVECSHGIHVFVTQQEAEEYAA